MTLRTTPSVLAVTAAFVLFGCSKSPSANPPAVSPPAKLAAGVVPFRVPQLREIQDSAMRVAAERGLAILQASRDSLPHNVGNSLRCTSCHFSAGTTRNALPLVGAYSRFPQFRARSGRVDLLEDRINDCLERSMNGKALDAKSREMRDIVAYIAFLSLGVPAGARVEGQGLPKLETLRGDTTRGAIVVRAECSRCHGAAGAGTVAAPPLWGSMSYNNGAGMSRVAVLAAFAHQLMPFDKPGSLTAQQAFDVASYIDSRPRPDFPGRSRDWPKGDVPADLGYPVPHGEKHLSQR